MGHLHSQGGPEAPTIQDLSQSSQLFWFDEECPHRLGYLNTWFAGVVAVWRGLGVAAKLKELQH